MKLADYKILITGATGSLGKQLIFELDQLGIRPVAHVRSTSDCTYIDSLGLEKRVADLRDKEQVEKLVTDVDAVIHTAAWVDFRRNRLTQFTGINTFGAVDMFRAAQKAGVKRFLHVSTVAAVGAMRRNANEPDIRDLVNEESEFNLEQLRIPYIMTKRAAEVELLKYLPGSPTELVMVNPSIIIAPSNSGDDRSNALKTLGKLIIPQFPNRINMVDLRDLAPAVLTALETGKNGQRYILAGDNISIRDLILASSSILDKIPHLVKIPRPLLDIAAKSSLVTGKIFGRGKIPFYPDIVKMLNYDWVYSSKKAREDLNYKNRSVHTSLSDLLTNHFYGTYLKPTP